MSDHKIICYAPGDRCLGCDHYHGKAPKCKYAGMELDSGDIGVDGKTHLVTFTPEANETTSGLQGLDILNESLLAQERQRAEKAERDLATLTEWKDTLVQTGDDALQDVQSLKRELSASEAKLIEARKDLSDLQSTFDLQWAAAQRAIREWQAEHPGAENTWPDHKNLLLWLMRKITEKSKQPDMGNASFNLSDSNNHQPIKQ